MATTTGALSISRVEEKDFAIRRRYWGGRGLAGPRPLERQLRRDPGLRKRDPRAVQRQRVHERRGFRGAQRSSRCTEGRCQSRARRHCSIRDTLDHVSPSPFRKADGSMTPMRWLARRSSPSSGVICHVARLHRQLARNVARRRDDRRPLARAVRSGAPPLGIDTPTLLGAWETAPYCTMARRPRA